MNLLHICIWLILILIKLTDKSRLIMLYALCGFANFSSVGILLSGLSAMIPERRMDLISVSGKALGEHYWLPA